MMEASIFNTDFVNDSSNCFDLQETPTWLRAVHMTSLSIIILTSLLGNGTVLLLVAKCKQLRTRSVIVSLSVVVVDLMLTLTYTVPSLASTAAKRWPFSHSGCMAFSYLSLEAITTRWFIMAVLSVDRFSTVRFPFSYEKRSKGVLGAVTVAAWMVPLLMSIPIVAGFGEAAFRSNIPTCRFNCVDNKKCKLYYTGYFTVSFLFGAILPIVLYVWLYWKAGQLRPSATVLGRMAMQIASGAIISQPIAHLDKNSSSERRARLTFLLIFVTVLATSLPVFTFLLIRTTNQTVFCKLPPLVHFIVHELFMSSASLDPLVIMRDKDFRQCLRDLCCCKTRTMSQDSAVEHASNSTKRIQSSRPSIENSEQSQVLLTINGILPNVFCNVNPCPESTQL